MRPTLLRSHLRNKHSIEIGFNDLEAVDPGHDRYSDYTTSDNTSETNADALIVVDHIDHIDDDDGDCNGLVSEARG